MILFVIAPSQPTFYPPQHLFSVTLGEHRLPWVSASSSLFGQPFIPFRRAPFLFPVVHFSLINGSYIFSCVASNSPFLFLISPSPADILSLATSCGPEPYCLACDIYYRGVLRAKPLFALVYLFNFLLLPPTFLPRARSNLFPFPISLSFRRMSVDTFTPTYDPELKTAMV